MKIPFKRERETLWIVLESSLICGEEEILRFVKEEITQEGLAQKNALERIVSKAQRQGIIALYQGGEMKKLLKKRGVIRGKKADYSEQWYEVKDGFISLKKGKNKGFVVDVENR